MEVRRPKAAHSWGELVNEIGIIVLGVLIALGAEQGVEALHWRHQAVEARAAMRSELLDSAEAAFTHRAIFKCNSDALGKLREDLLKSGPAWKGRPAHYKAPIFTWDATAWRTAQAGGTLAHMSADEAGGFSGAYQFLGAAADLEAKSQDEAAEIDLTAFDHSLADGERGRLLTAVNKAERQNFLLAVGAKQFLERIAGLGVVLPDATKQKIQARIGAAPDFECYTPPKVD
jgi:hypothetical protein